MRATELITKLQKTVKEHGDHEVFSYADYEIVEHVEFRDDFDYFQRCNMEHDKRKMIVLA